MRFSEYEPGIESLRNEDNKAWIDKVTCWQKNERENEKDYNIYCFCIVVTDEQELRENYHSITGAIATDFQARMSKVIEKWNIYLIFETCKSISTALKDEIEQNKYSTRKLVWGNLDIENINSIQYIDEKLFSLNVGEIKEYSFVSESLLLSKIKVIDSDLYNALMLKTEEVEVRVKKYLGETK